MAADVSPSMTKAFRRFLLIETPLSLLLLIPGAFIVASLSEPGSVTSTRVALTVIPTTIPFLPWWWHLLDRAWWRPALAWMVITVLPAMAASLLLWTVAA